MMSIFHYHLQGGGEIVMDDFGAKGSTLEVSDPDKHEFPPKVMKGLLEFDEMPSKSDFEDLVERADAMVGEAREGRAAALADEQEGPPSSGSKGFLQDILLQLPNLILVSRSLMP
jgi:hypothetical protein